MYKLENFLTSGLKHPLWWMPWATIFYAFQYYEKGRNEILFDTRVLKLMKT